MKINLPNQITIARFILAIIFLALLSQFSAIEQPPRYWLLDVCLGIFIIAALSDILDGYLARKYNEVTSFGRVIDPFVDKVLVCGAFMILAGHGFVRDGRPISDITAWMVVLIIGRELLVTGLRGFSEGKGDAFGAMFWGKIKMLLQSITAGYILLSVAHADGFTRWHGFALIRVGLVWLTVIVTILSMITYLYAARKILSETSRPAGQG